MAYEIWIVRPGRPISLEEWLSVVDSESSMRRAEGDLHLHNPYTSDTITFPNNGGDAELFFPDDASWEHVFYWNRRGHITLTASPLFDNPEGYIRIIVRAFASRLGAIIQGEEGEEYS